MRIIRWGLVVVAFAMLTCNGVGEAATLTGYWNFDSKAGSTVADQVAGSTHSATLTSGADITGGSLGYGGSGEALRPNAGGGAGYARVTDAHAAADHYDFNSSFTWHAQVKWDAQGSGGNAGIISRSPLTSNWNQGSKAMFLESNGHLEWDTGWVSNPGTSTDMRDQQWHQVIAVYDDPSGILSLIVDGNTEFNASHNVDGWDEHTNNHNGGIAHDGLAIGWTSPNFENAAFAGLIDDAAIFSEALSGNDLAQLIRDGPSSFMPVEEETVPEPASIAIWSLLGLAGFGYSCFRRRAKK